MLEVLLSNFREQEVGQILPITWSERTVRPVAHRQLVVRGQRDRKLEGAGRGALNAKVHSNPKLTPPLADEKMARRKCGVNIVALPMLNRNFG